MTSRTKRNKGALDELASGVDGAPPADAPTETPLQRMFDAVEAARAAPAKRKKAKEEDIWPLDTIWELFASNPIFLGVIAGAILCFTYDGTTFVGDWTPGAIVASMLVGTIVYYRGRLGRFWPLTGALCLLVYVMIGGLFALGAVWWQSNRRGVVAHWVSMAGKKDAELIVNRLEYTIIRWAIYWPFVAIRMGLEALIWDVYVFMYDYGRSWIVWLVQRRL